MYFSHSIYVRVLPHRHQSINGNRLVTTIDRRTRSEVFFKTRALVIDPGLNILYSGFVDALRMSYNDIENHVTMIGPIDEGSQKIMLIIDCPFVRATVLEMATRESFCRRWIVVRSIV